MAVGTKSAILPQFNGPEVLFSASGKAKLFAKNVSRNYNLDYSGVSLTVFPSRTNLKLHNIPVTSQLFRNVMIDLDLLKASGPDSIPLVVLKNCEPELSHIQAELFNTSLKEPSFLEYLKVSLVVPVFKFVEERCTTK